MLGLAWDGGEVAHAASASGASSLSLGTPVELADLGSWVAASSASALLQVERAASAAHAETVRLVLSGSEALSALGL